MASFPSRSELVQIGADEIVAQNALIDPSVVGVEGHPANIITSVGAAMAEEIAYQGQQVEQAQYLDTAAKLGDVYLDRLVYDRYGLVRNGATPSVGSVAFSRPSAAHGAISLPAGTVLVSDDGIRFLTINEASFGAAALGPVSVGVRSVLAGAGQRATAGTIEAFETTPDDSSITVTNAAATAGDDDGESNASLAERARRYFPNAARGTLTAVEYGALQVAGIKVAVASEVTTPQGDPARYCKIQVADRLGESTAELGDAVELELRKWRPCGMRVEVVRASVTYIAIALQIATLSGFDPSAVRSQVKAAIVSALSALKPGATLWHHIILDAAKKVPGAVVEDGAVTTPATALTATDDQVYRTKLELIDITSA